MLFNLFKKKDKIANNDNNMRAKKKNYNQQVANRKGEIGEYKIDIQLSQLPKDYKYLNDLMIENPKSISGYSQIDHLVITPYGIYVIETKNYQGTIYGSKNRKNWLINGKFKMMNPVIQNYGHIEALKKYIDKSYHDKFKSMITFTKRCTLKIDMELRDINSDELVIYDVYLNETLQRKESILKLKNHNQFTDEDRQVIYESITNANITDPKARETHTTRIKEKKSNAVVMSNSQCVVCSKKVSEKVVTYCLSNQKFNGKIYCYDHQKTLNV
ncbi:nuclease-related domain-containing protein [Ornithinibacillus salinisoli]|uniref:Nuclease-related domain-containing protein n=1 Tax=Ornithinibacillus salinisoli TaxID=1848459 RepID=A0ABW4VTY5_9BACI